MKSMVTIFGASSRSTPTRKTINETWLRNALVITSEIIMSVTCQPLTIWQTIKISRVTLNDIVPHTTFPVYKYLMRH